MLGQQNFCPIGPVNQRIIFQYDEFHILIPSSHSIVLETVEFLEVGRLKSKQWHPSPVCTVLILFFNFNSSFKWYKLQPDATVPMCNIRVDVHSAIWCTSLKGPKENLYHRYTFYVPDYLLRSFFCKIPMYLSLQGYTINSYILIESLKHHGSQVLSNFFYFQSKLKILTQKEMEKEYY